MPELEVVRSLIQAGADVNVLDQQGETPLLLAVRARDPGIVRMLVEAGAAPDLGSDSHGSPRQFAEELVTMHEAALADPSTQDEREVRAINELLTKAREILGAFPTDKDL
ncbi:ankyrin repeat domain-containing protein [Rhodopirellula sp. JC639]|uniref:ankyrin repeat domain-containing protein n=1 Tax=Stieleria mannarensis TaxID=2755585 RepID=UPI0016037084|nr:ankyrin repeat domain-containing protein [Rhodopirellula sp. JC639]